ncbi:MAG: hypothetical protein DBX55_08880 [Verrucomicrobia bacterium]|nr:MAG: hypothetical protein DBX55_08880 [Verrucomicrobiota bacterium]
MGEVFAGLNYHPSYWGQMSLSVMGENFARKFYGVALWERIKKCGRTLDGENSALDRPPPHCAGVLKVGKMGAYFIFYAADSL